MKLSTKFDEFLLSFGSGKKTLKSQKLKAKTKKSKAKSKKPKKKELAGTHVKLNFKRHFMPPLVGLLVAIAVFGFFNSQLLSSRIAYYINSRNTQSSSKVVPASSAIPKDAPPNIIIKDINVNAPVIYDEKTVNQNSFQLALRRGVVHYPDTALPGQPGNVVIFGHSSGQWWAPGDYKFVFTLLDKLEAEDLIYIDYQGTRYIYRVYDKIVVKPSDLSVLNQGSKNILTLITCTPVGSSTNRLIVRAQQILPKASNNTSSTQAATRPATAEGSLPSSSSGFWDDLKGLFN